MNTSRVLSFQELSVLDSSTRMEHLLNHPLVQKEIWHTVNDLGMHINQHDRKYSINFSRIPRKWFKDIAKVYILYRYIQGISAPTLIGDLGKITLFAIFLESQYIYSFSEIKDETFEVFFAGRKQTISSLTYNTEISVLKVFFETGAKQSWFSTSTYWFLGKHKFLVPENVNYIPEEVWNQLDKHLHNLPEQLQRMVLLMRTKALRVGELLQMPFNCLRQKRDGEWEIHFTNGKLKNVPENMDILPELAAIIQEQQNYVRDQIGEEFDYLFCSSQRGPNFHPAPRVMSKSCFNEYLNRLAVACEIRDNSGQVWRFSSHQFRRTVATILANSGVREYITQCYLRHRSPDMKKYYIHLFPETLKREIDELKKDKKLVDITGAVVARYRAPDEMTEFLRRKLYPRTIQVGECHRPIVKDPCLTTNACWRCEHYRVTEDDLPFLKADLPRIQEAIAESEQIGRTRTFSELRKDEAFLVRSIEALEKSDD